MFGFDAKNISQTMNANQPALVRNLQVLPTVGFQVSPGVILDPPD
jgi:hypothetical protein